MRKSLVAALIIVLLAVGLPMASTSSSHAAESCQSAYGEIVKRSSVFGSVLYRFRNTMQLCVEQNGSYSSITMASSWTSVRDVDASWDYEGLAVSNNQNGYYYNLWTTHRSNRTGHFQQCWWFYCNNLYPRMDLEGRNNGIVYIVGRNDG